MRKVLNFLFILLIGFNFVKASEIEYKFGRGFSIDNRFYLGGYTSFQYEKRENGYYQYKIDDIAILGFYTFGKFKIFAELEAKDVYVKSKGEEEENNLKLHTERLYLEYAFSDYIKVRGGRFITPLGIWNQVHINALKWTTSNPATAEWFFPRFMTGLNLYGFFPFFDESIEYQLFIQKTKNIDSGYNNVKTDDFYGFQIKKFFGVNKYIGINGGRFYDIYFKETSTFGGIFGYLNIKKFYLFGEFYYAYENEEHHLTYDQSFDKKSYYIQGVYRVFPKNYFTLRKEYFRDYSDNGYLNVWTIGWNYKPLFNISLKGEYQIFKKRDNRFLASFAVLF
ncbi:hypothetical protein [Persephonella sp.]